VVERVVTKVVPADGADVEVAPEVLVEPEVRDGVGGRRDPVVLTVWVTVLETVLETVATV
jgi:hypothetical protein